MLLTLLLDSHLLARLAIKSIWTNHLFFFALTNHDHLFCEEENCSVDLLITNSFTHMSLFNLLPSLLLLDQPHWLSHRANDQRRLSATVTNHREVTRCRMSCRRIRYVISPKSTPVPVRLPSCFPFVQKSAQLVVVECYCNILPLQQTAFLHASFVSMLSDGEARLLPVHSGRLVVPRSQNCNCFIHFSYSHSFSITYHCCCCCGDYISI